MDKIEIMKLVEILKQLTPRQKQVFKNLVDATLEFQEEFKKVNK